MKVLRGGGRPAETLGKDAAPEPEAPDTQSGDQPHGEAGGLRGEREAREEAGPRWILSCG